MLEAELALSSVSIKEAEQSKHQALDDAQAGRNHEELVLQVINALVASNGSLRATTQILATVTINLVFLVAFLSSWPFKSLDDNMLMALPLVANTMIVLCSLALNPDTGAMDAWGDTTTLGVVLGLNHTLVMLYWATMDHLQLPFICNHLILLRIQHSWLNRFAKSSQFGQTFAFTFIFAPTST